MRTMSGTYTVRLSAGGRLIFHVFFAALAEFARNLIREPHRRWACRRPCA